MLNNWIKLFVLPVIGSISLSSQLAQANPITLSQAIDHALQNNPDLGASSQMIQAAEGQISVAQTGRMPQARLSFNAKYSDNPLDAFADKMYIGDIKQADFDPAKLNDPDISQLYIGELSINVPVYDGGRTDANVRGARASFQATQFQHHRLEEFVVSNTRQAYLAALYAKRSIGIIDQAIESANEHAMTTAKLVHDGRIVQSDQLTAELNLSALKSRRAQAQGQLNQSLTQLKWAMGFEQDAAINVVDDSALLPAKLSSTFDQDISHAIARRQDIKALQQQVSIHRADADAAATVKMPTFNVVASLNSYQDGFAPDDASWRLMGVVSMPLYDGGLSSRRIATAHKMASATKARIVSMEQRIRNEIKLAREGVNEAQARLEIANGNVTKAERNVALVKKRYGQGRTILIDLLQTERVLVEARNEALAAEFLLQKNLAALVYARGDALSQQANSK